MTTKREAYRLSDRWGRLMNGLVQHEAELWTTNPERGIDISVITIAFAATHRIAEHRVHVEGPL